MQTCRSHTILVPAMAIFMSCSTYAQNAQNAQNAQTSVEPAPVPSAIVAAWGTPQRQAAEQALLGLGLASRLKANASEAGTNRVLAIDDYSKLRYATIGDGFEINLIDPEALLAGKPIDACIRGTRQWRFLVLVGGKPVGLLTIARIGDSWKMVETGASGLAEEIAAIEARYAARTPRPQLRFIRSLQAVADFIEVTPLPVSGQSVQRRYIALASARVALTDDEASGADTTNAASARPGPELSESEIKDRLSARVRLGMQDLRFTH